MFSAVVNAIESNLNNIKMVNIAVRALYWAMEYTKDYFKDNKGGIIIETIRKCYSVKNEDIHEIAT